MKNRNDSQGKDFYVYSHNRVSDGKCFYIGKGKGTRYIEGRSRNQHWHRVVKEEGGYTFKILVNGLKEKDAFKIESSFINQIGYDNLTNIKPNWDHARRRKLAKARVGPNNPNFGKRGSTNGKVVNIDGKTYFSVREAIRSLGLPRYTVEKRLKSEDYPKWIVET